MIVSLIVAMDKNRGIGKNNQLPWNLPSDLKRFKRLTMGHFLIVGRKTFESIGRALPGRKMIVVTRNLNYQARDCSVAHSLEDAFDIARTSGEDEVFIGGGAELFEEAMEFADRIYLTEVKTSSEADVFFPDFLLQDWRVKENTFTDRDEQNQHPSCFVILEKIRN